MARYKNGINGPLKGKIGKVVAATCRGVDYLRSLAEPSGKAPSQAQLNQRLRFALVMGWLKPLLDLINIGFPGPDGGQTPINRAVSFHLKEAVTGTAPDYEIDFAKVVLSRGELQSSWIRKLSFSASALLHVKWEDQQPSVFCRDDDRATFILYNSLKGQFVTFKSVADRVAKEVKLQMPGDFAGDAVHIWMNYVNASADLLSTTTYLGQVICPE